MKKVSEETKKYRVINRILNYSEIYSKNELQKMEIEALLSIQKETLIALIVSIKFKNRWL